MSQYKSMSGAGKKPYVWKDTTPATRRPSRSIRRTEAYTKSVPRKTGYSGSAAAVRLPKPVATILALGLVVAMFITVVSAIETSAEKGKLESLQRKQQELRETLESTVRTLEMEKRPQVLCQLAEEKLYMVRPGESVALNMNGSDGQTAGR